MIILTLNVARPSQARARELITWLSAHPADVVVLTEISRGSGSEIVLEAYENAGYSVAVTSAEPGDRGVAVITAIPPVSVGLNDSLGIRALKVSLQVDNHPKDIIGIYAPSSDPSPMVTGTSLERKKLWLDQLLHSLPSFIDGTNHSVFVVGDVNVADARLMADTPWLADFERTLFHRLETMGYHDLGGGFSQQADFYSWEGRGGQKLRFDYAFGQLHEKSLVVEHRYIHDVRLSGYSDHSALVVAVNAPRLADHRIKELVIPREQFFLF